MWIEHEHLSIKLTLGAIQVNSWGYILQSYCAYEISDNKIFNIDIDKIHEFQILEVDYPFPSSMAMKRAFIKYHLIQFEVEHEKLENLIAH